MTDDLDNIMGPDVIDRSDQVGWFGSDMWNAAKKPLKKVIKSKFTLAVAGGVALAFPPAAPAVPALYCAAKMVKAAEAKKGSKQHNAFLAIMKRTIAVAKSTHPKAADAKRAVKFIAKAKKKSKKGPKRVVVYIEKSGRIHT